MRNHECITTSIELISGGNNEIVVICCESTPEEHRKQLKDAGPFAKKYGAFETELGVWKSDKVAIRVERKNVDLDDWRYYHENDWKEFKCSILL